MNAYDVLRLTIRYRGRKDIKHVTTLARLFDRLRLLKLPGLAPPRFDFMSWDPLPWTESWDITVYGIEGVMHSRPMRASYKIYSSGRAGLPQGWTEWHETSFPEQWAVRKTVYSPEIAEIGNPVYFDREAATFVKSLRSGLPSGVPADQAHNINGGNEVEL